MLTLGVCLLCVVVLASSIYFILPFLTHSVDASRPSFVFFFSTHPPCINARTAILLVLQNSSFEWLSPVLWAAYSGSARDILPFWRLKRPIRIFPYFHFTFTTHPPFPRCFAICDLRGEGSLKHSVEFPAKCIGCHPHIDWRSMLLVEQVASTFLFLGPRLGM